MTRTSRSTHEAVWYFTYIMVQRGGIVVLTMGLSLVVFCSVTTVRSVIPMLVEPGTLGFMILYGLCCILSFGILFNYVAVACLCGPNIDPKETKRLTEQAEALPPQERCRLLDAPRRFCHICERLKAPREYHCRICGRCIARRDHHCPWINNCVQAENNRYFLMMVLYLLLSTGFVSSMLCAIYTHSVWHGSTVAARDVKRSTSHQFCKSGVYSSPILLLFGVCIITFFILLFLFGAATLAALRNETAVESFIVAQKQSAFQGSLVPFRNPYDLGRQRNLLALFETKGDPLITHLRRGGRISNIWIGVWLLLPTLRPSAFDGMHYVVFDDVVHAV
ncbi:hypothetical protein, conserved [Trypanosoma brucei brucei TREU927]|uniref:Palmitoyltransferase n=1 Tax=Trypanosoma brucei brucei (strain 927/4 GUTat10.1) TaxID=185431 RepID=Q38CH1_TRYB2|nr:hypothetical protein, conserved [Trypanosoma brucei brucei TREU927]EAN77499.1 hypothetical protein, conserved [Trypanosoma brucei brucei TREU927]